MEYFLVHGLIGEPQAVLVRSCGIDTTEWRPPVDREAVARGFRAEAGYALDDVLVVMVSRALTSKGVSEFIEASHLLARRFPKARFLLVGDSEEDGGLGVSRQWLTQQAGEWPNFRWLGQRDDVARILTASDVFVLPSYYREGVPRSLLEAMAMELPLVTTDNVGCREVVQDGLNGFKVPVRDPGALASAIGTLVADPELRLGMGQASRRIVETEFDESFIVSQLLARLYGFPASAGDTNQAVAGCQAGRSRE
jgi:N,N'-diacetylbacillosaminyl-diphospho-undecaprenol alpha-1,3-N-acetylgalactosaminyltransferase